MRDLLAKIEACRSTEVLWSLMLGYFRGKGIGKVSYHHLPGDPDTPQPVIVRAEGFDRRWVCTYIEEELFLVDPIPDLALRSPTPFLWREVAGQVQLSPAQRRYMALMEQADLGNGLAFQVFGPGLRNAYVGLGFAPDAPPPAPADVLEMQFAAQAAHIRVCALVPLRGTRPSLTPRERDVLQWIARGKSNSVIADILGLSPHTIDTLMRRVYDKLGTRDRTTAAIAGLGAGLILP